MNNILEKKNIRIFGLDEKVHTKTLYFIPILSRALGKGIMRNVCPVSDVWWEKMGLHARILFKITKFEACPYFWQSEYLLWN